MFVVIWEMIIFVLDSHAGTILGMPLPWWGGFLLTVFSCNTMFSCSMAITAGILPGSTLIPRYESIFSLKTTLVVKISSINEWLSAMAHKFWSFNLMAPQLHGLWDAKACVPFYRFLYFIIIFLPITPHYIQKYWQIIIVK